MTEMDMFGFYTGKIFDAYEYLGAHPEPEGTYFRVYAPNAERVSVIGEFNDWEDTPMEPVYDGNFYECLISEAREGMLYKLRVYEKGGKPVDHADPYAFGMEKPPGNASVIRNLKSYMFRDARWMKQRTDGKDAPVNIYEMHPGSWKLPNLSLIHISEPTRPLF